MTQDRAAGAGEYRESYHDWADEKADRILHRILMDSNRAARRDEIATALRAAREEGERKGRLARATDAPSASSEASVWLPISEAPKDGTEVLTLSKSGVRVAYYDDSGGFFSPGWFVAMENSRISGTYVEPTHFMPLPATSEATVWRPTHQHRNGEQVKYVGMGYTQSDAPMPDMSSVFVYQTEDGRLWARKDVEWKTRFKRLPAPPQTSTDGG